MKRKAGIAVLALTSLLGLGTTAMARDHDDYRSYNRGIYSNRYNGGLTARERHQIEERREREARLARERLQREQRRSLQQGYARGYYDRFGNWHSSVW